MKTKEHIHTFENMFSIILPDIWSCEVDESIFNCFSNVNPIGALQISFFRIEENENLEELAKNHLDRFVNQFNIDIDIDTYKVIEAPYYTIANTSGISEGDFIKIWVINNNEKMLLITYNSIEKTKELDIVDNIVYSINFE